MPPKRRRSTGGATTGGASGGAGGGDGAGADARAPKRNVTRSTGKSSKSRTDEQDAWGSQRGYLFQAYVTVLYWLQKCGNQDAGDDLPAVLAERHEDLTVVEEGPDRAEIQLRVQVKNVTSKAKVAAYTLDIMIMLQKCFNGFTEISDDEASEGRTLPQDNVTYRFLYNQPPQLRPAWKANNAVKLLETFRRNAKDQMKTSSEKHDEWVEFWRKMPIRKWRTFVARSEFSRDKMAFVDMPDKIMQQLNKSKLEIATFLHRAAQAVLTQHVFEAVAAKPEERVPLNKSGLLRVLDEHNLLGGRALTPEDMTKLQAALDWQFKTSRGLHGDHGGSGGGGSNYYLAQYRY